jgi:hypothetical protein
MKGTGINRTGEDLAVYGDAPPGHPWHNKLYRLPPGRMTPPGMDCDGYLVPVDRTVYQRVLPNRAGPVAVKYREPITFTVDLVGTMYEGTIDQGVYASGELQWEIPAIRQADVGSLPEVPGHVAA